jgi:hypothetical protein
MGRGRSSSCLYRWAVRIVARAVYIVNDPGSSRRGRGGHPRTSVLGLRGASPSLCGHRLLHCHRLDRFVAVGLDSLLLGLDIHCRWVSFAVVALDWPQIRLITIEPSRRRRSHLVIILPVLPPPADWL